MAGMMMAAVAPKSDQLNAEDLIGGDMIVTISGVKIDLSADQKISFALDGHSRVYRPCKTMGRAIVACWGGDESQYVGRSLQLFRDPSAKWGGVEVGGIRIRAASHIDKPVICQLTEKRGQRRPWTIQPLAMRGQQSPRQDDAKADAPALSAELLARAEAEAARGVDALRAMWDGLGGDEKAALKAEMTRLKATASEADRVRAENATFGLASPTPEQFAAEAAAHAEIEAQRSAMEGNA